LPLIVGLLQHRQIFALVFRAVALLEQRNKGLRSAEHPSRIILRQAFVDTQDSAALE
jgi:hypothetical protein